MKSPLHPRNRHRNGYDFTELQSKNPSLTEFVRLSPRGEKTIDFANPLAVKALNTALLCTYYKIDYYDIPPGYLCPPIPGRADYIHYLADILTEETGRNAGQEPRSQPLTGPQIRVLDLGVGANCIYPILGHTEYGWTFVASDIDTRALESARTLVERNPSLKGNIDCRLQTVATQMLRGIIDQTETFDALLCNPPFHASQAEAQAASLRKVQNLQQKKINTAVLNFGGRANELWCPGGELAFVSQLIDESKIYSTRCRIFTSLVSKEQNLPPLYAELRKVGARRVKTVSMGQGNKISRILVWSFY